MGDCRLMPSPATPPAPSVTSRKNAPAVDSRRVTDPDLVTHRDLVTDRSDRSAEPRRDLLIDLARAGALGIVVLWHWVFTTKGSAAGARR